MDSRTNVASCVNFTIVKWKERRSTTELNLKGQTVSGLDSTGNKSGSLVFYPFQSRLDSSNQQHGSHSSKGIPPEMKVLVVPTDRKKRTGFES